MSEKNNLPEGWPEDPLKPGEEEEAICYHPEERLNLTVPASTFEDIIEMSMPAQDKLPWDD